MIKKRGIKKIFNILFVALCLNFVVCVLLIVFSDQPVDLQTCLEIILVVNLLHIPIFYGPLFYLSYTYLSIDTELEIEGNQYSICSNKQGINYLFTAEEIIEVEHHLRLPKYRKGAPTYGWDSFYYLKVKLTNDRCFLITCFSVDNVYQLFPYNKVKRIKRIIPVIKSIIK